MVLVALRPSITESFTLNPLGVMSSSRRAFGRVPGKREPSVRQRMRTTINPRNPNADHNRVAFTFEALYLARGGPLKMSSVPTGCGAALELRDIVVTEALALDVARLDSAVGERDAAGVKAMSRSAPFAGCAEGVLSFAVRQGCGWACPAGSAFFVLVVPVAAWFVRTLVPDLGTIDSVLAGWQPSAAATPVRLGDGFINSHPQSSRTSTPQQDQARASGTKAGAASR